MSRNAYYDGAWKYKTTDHASSYWQDGGGQHIWRTTASDTEADSALTWSDAMIIDASGNVGIGETTPLGNLHVKAQDTGATANSVGNLLVLEGTENGLSILSSTSGAGYILFGDSDDNAHGGILYDQSAGAMRFRTGSTWDQMKILANGNVGIGIASPNGRLQFDNGIDTRKIVLYEGANNNYQFYGFGVEGSTLVYSTYTNTDDHVFFSGASASSRNELMRIEGGGNVGIGTSSPGAPLHVNSGY